MTDLQDAGHSALSEFYVKSICFEIWYLCSKKSRFYQMKEACLYKKVLKKITRMNSRSALILTDRV